MLQSTIDSFSCLFGFGIISFRSWESAVGIGTSYRLDGPSFESRKGKMIYSSPKPSQGHWCTFPWVKRLGV
jgi:hypothetical protein